VDPTREPIGRKQIGLLGFGLFIGLPIIFKWQEDTTPFGEFFGISYPLQLAYFGILGAILCYVSFGEKGKVIRSIVFGLATVPLFSAAIEAYISFKTTVHSIEIAILGLIFFAPIVAVWKFIDFKLATPEKNSEPS
jgi:hypothetical protein